MATHRFDQTSGLIFSEITHHAPGGPNAFLNKCRGRKPEMTVSKHGPASLEAVAMRSVLCNLEFVGLEALRWVPVPILKRIWEAIEKNSLDSTRIWQLFTLALPSDPPVLLRRQWVPVPEPRLDAYLAIHTDTFAWLSVLTMIDVPLVYDEFVKLGNIRNLAVLHVASSRRSHTTESVDDTVVRGWSRLSESGSFPRLKTIFLRNQAGVTMRSLDFLCQVPALTGLCVSGCGMSVHDVPAKMARDHGWRRSRDGFSAYFRSRLRRPGPELGDGQSWCTLVEQYVLSRQQTERFASAANASPGHVAPILALQLGREASRQSFRMGSTDEIQWFERNAGSPTMADSPKIDETEKSEMQEEGSSRKRRKMRSVKKQDLTEMFSGF